MSRYRFIAEEKAHHSVALLCRVLHVAKSAFYAWQTQQPSTRARADDHLINEIRAIHDDSRCTYGAPRVHAELRRRGKRVGRKRVARLMRNAGLVGRPLPAPISADDSLRPDDARAGPGATSVSSERAQPAVVLGHLVHPHVGGLVVFGSHPGCLFQKGRRLGAHRPSAH